MKKCSNPTCSCLNPQLDSEFSPDKRKKDGLQSRCKTCFIHYKHSDRGKEIARKVESSTGKWSRGKVIAKRRGLEWSIPRTDYFNIIKESCYYCSSPIDKFGIGLDRINNDEGYTPQNVLPCCGSCNRIRSNKFTVKEMLLIGKTLKQIFINRKNEQLLTIQEEINAV